MTASIELVEAAKRLMDAANYAAHAEYMTDQELRDDALRHAQAEIAGAQRRIDCASMIVRKMREKPSGHDRNILRNKELEEDAETVATDCYGCATQRHSCEHD